MSRRPWSSRSITDRRLSVDHWASGPSPWARSCCIRRRAVHATTARSKRVSRPSPRACIMRRSPPAIPRSGPARIWKPRVGTPTRSPVDRRGVLPMRRGSVRHALAEERRRFTRLCATRRPYRIDQPPRVQQRIAIVDTLRRLGYVSITRRADLVHSLKTKKRQTLRA